MSWQPDLLHRLIRSSGLVLLWGALAWPAWALDKTRWAVLNEAAQEASRDCLHLMHHDTDEFSACVDAKFERGAGKPEARLGLAYLGLVGCLSAGRIATLHSDICTQSYLRQVDGLRRTLRLGDKELCPTVRGDCDSRIAQIEAVRQTMQKGAARRK